MGYALPFSNKNASGLNFARLNFARVNFGCGNDKHNFQLQDPNPSNPLGFNHFKQFIHQTSAQEERRFYGKGFVALAKLPLLPFVWAWESLKSSKVYTDQEAYTPNPKELYRHVEALTKLDRSYLNPKGLNAAADYIQHEWENQGLTVEKQQFKANHQDYTNLMVSFGPPDAERIVVGAHYDVCITEVPDGTFKPGADDNASSVAGILELTRLLKTHHPQLKHRIDIVAYTNEEPPYFRTQHMGSAVHAKSLYEQKAKVKGMLTLDMIGFYSDAPNSQQMIPGLKRFYPTQGNFIGVVGEVGSLNMAKKTTNAINAHSTVPAYKMVGPSFIPGVDYSDHQNYSKYGWPAVMITDLPTLRNPNYHHNTDTIETLNFDKMAQVIKGVYGLIANF
ncbi:MAG: M20/M25/M40 family metallo-hydrolase [Cyanobacteria bacterium]|nr:M20/M25/M40 family metallo-hydrolase [Cyanobacteriota bacterium]